MSSEPKQDAIQVRLSPELRARLNRVALQAELGASEIIRRAVDSYLREAEMRGALSIPLNNSVAEYPSKDERTAPMLLNEKPKKKAQRKG